MGDMRRMGQGMEAGLPLGRDYYGSDSVTLARDMLGKILCRRHGDGTVCRYRISEAETYYGMEDTACHAHRCPTGRAKVMFSQGGLAYVHRCHMYNLLTIVTGPEGHPEGVLFGLSKRTPSDSQEKIARRSPEADRETP